MFVLDAHCNKGLGKFLVCLWLSTELIEDIWEILKKKEAFQFLLTLKADNKSITQLHLKCDFCDKHRLHETNNHFNHFETINESRPSSLSHFSFLLLTDGTSSFSWNHHCTLVDSFI